MGNFNLQDYETVHERLPKFYALYPHPKGKVITDMVYHKDDYSLVVFKASLLVDDVIIATGWAFEEKGKGYVNATSHIENAETSAIGRALANIGLAGDKRPSREEMQKAERMASEFEKPNPLTPEAHDDIPADPPKKPAIQDAELVSQLRAHKFSVAQVNALMKKHGTESNVKGAGIMFDWNYKEMIEA